MAIDPRLVKRTVSQKYRLPIHNLDPNRILPNGDRYLVEVIEMDETVLFGSILVVTQEQPTTNNPMTDPMVERRGVLPAVVIGVGNGHLLGLPDLQPVEKDIPYHYNAGERPWPSVDMFFEPGDVVLVDINAKGRALKIADRELRICDQLSILAKIDGVRLERDDDGWKMDKE